MEISGNLAPILGSNLVCLQSTHLSLLQDKRLLQAIDELGKLSAKHSGNKNPLTSCEKLISSGNVLHLVWEYDSEKDVSRLLGYLKVGRKQLYIFDKKMNPYEGNFKGVGTQLFSFMMESEHVDKPGQLAFDNPSATLLSFLAKKFYLDDPIWQNTNFVVFPQLSHHPCRRIRRQYQKAAVGWNMPLAAMQQPRKYDSGNKTQGL
uniref:N-acetyltransferase domain-containing protein n=1 Tax=Ditylenchus dipsaci TaxID=166011 RepID=A0A915DDZ1_9BILA